MKALIILSNPQSGASFCGAIASEALEVLQKTTNDVIVRDLYAQDFDPILTQSELATPNDQLSGEIREQIRELIEAEVLIVVHPNWWGMPPANLVGWIDRVIRQGFCYQFTERGVVTKLDGKKVIVFTTSNTPAEIEETLNHDPLKNLWTNIVANTVGFRNLKYVNFSSVIMSDAAQRESWLGQVKKIVTDQMSADRQ